MDSMTLRHTCKFIFSVLISIAFCVSQVMAGQALELEAEFQNGNRYSSLSCDSSEQALNLSVDMKKGSSAGYLLHFGELDEWIKGEGIEVIDAHLKIYYIDEYWSKLKYHVGVSRSLDGSVHNIAPEPEDTVVIFGDKFPRDKKTKRPSWVSLSISPQLVMSWIKHDSRNHGLVLHVPRVNRGKDGDLIDLRLEPKTTGKLFVGFRSCVSPGDGKTPKLVVRYRVKGNAPPSPPVLQKDYSMGRIYSDASIKWTASIEPNTGDKISYQFEAGYSEGERLTWSDASVEISGSEAIWQSAVDSDRFYRNTDISEKDRKLWFRVRAVDDKGANSRWSVAGPLLVTDKPWTVWGTHGNRKIWPDIQPVNPHGAKVEIKAARNEWEPLQAAIMAHTALQDVAITATDLINDSGGKISAASVYRQHYLPISNTANTEYGHLGMVPDALVPLIHPVTGKATGGKYGGKVFDIPSGGMEVFWLDVYVGKEAKPGIYRGSVSISARGLNDVIIPVELEVFDFVLPSPKHLLATFQLGADNVRKSHQELRKRPNRKKLQAELAHSYEEMMHEHYINNWSPITGFNYGLNGVVVSVNDGKVSVDWSKFDQLVEPYMNGSAYKDKVPAQTLFTPYWIPVKKAKGEGWARRVNKHNYQNIDLGLFAQYIKEVERHMKEKGWLDKSYVFYFDEPFISKWKYSAFIQTSKVIRKHAPSLKILITDGYKGPDEYKKRSYITEPIEKYVDVWDPVTFQVSSLELANFYRKRKSEGKFDMWCQTLANSNPRRAVINLFPEYDMPFHRMWGVMSWNFGFQGIEWWETIVWWDGRTKQKLDPWVNPVAFPGFKQPLNSDGRLFFPGTEDAIGGPDIPISSIRMKAVREAIEDYEYLYLLDQLGGMDKFDINQLHTTESRKAKAMKSPMPMGKGPWHWWEGDPDIMMQARERIARLIEKYQLH